MAVEDFSSSYNLSLNWPWGLGPFREDITNTSISSLSVFVDDGGVVQFLNQFYSYAVTDPIDCASVPTFSKENNFIAGLNRAITTVPTFGTILYPTTLNDKVFFPDDIPEGYVPCIGQTMLSPDGEEVQIPILTIPAMSNFVTSTDPNTDLPTSSPVVEVPMRYLMKLGDGWTFKQKNIPRTSLEDIHELSVLVQFGLFD